MIYAKAIHELTYTMIKGYAKKNIILLSFDKSSIILRKILFLMYLFIKKNHKPFLIIAKFTFN